MNNMSRTRQLLALAGWLAVSYVAAALGAIASASAKSFYGQLAQPAWAPPAWLFGPVWTALYTVMGIAAWLVWRHGGFRRNAWPLGLFLAQLVVNALWSWLFFAWHHGALAFVDILVLWLVLAATVAAFWRARPVAGVLLVPYLLWVSFAAALNYAVWQLNPAVLG